MCVESLNPDPLLRQGWLFNICDDQARCVSDPTLGLSVWFRRLWLVRGPGRGIDQQLRDDRGLILRRRDRKTPGFLAPRAGAPGPGASHVQDQNSSLVCVCHVDVFPQDPSYRTAVAQRFLALRAGPWSDADVGGAVDALAARLQPAGLRYLNKWEAGF